MECHDNLVTNNSDQIAMAKDYLSKRNLSQESVITHEIGYCDLECDIPDEIKFYGKSELEMDFDNDGYSYFIRGRIIVPIRSEFGDVVGFATRKPSFEKGNAWWNISAPFKKGDHLFLLDKARKNIFKSNKIYLVEGYIDAIILYQEGLTETCGLMGTHLSPRKIGLIARYCNNICLCLDVDENQSGQKGQSKAITTLKEFGFSKAISCIENLPVGEDPDVYVSKHGLEEFLSQERRLAQKEIDKIYKNTRRKMKI